MPLQLGLEPEDGSVLPLCVFFCCFFADGFFLVGLYDYGFFFYCFFGRSLLFFLLGKTCLDLFKAIKVN